MTDGKWLFCEQTQLTISFSRLLENVILVKMLQCFVNMAPVMLLCLKSCLTLFHFEQFELS